MFPGAPPPVLAVVVVGTGITLAAQPRGLLARLRLIVPQHISSLYTRGPEAGVRQVGQEKPLGKGSRSSGHLLMCQGQD